MKHRGYNTLYNVQNGNSAAQDWKYNGIEYEDALGINIYEMDARQYDPAIARWTVIDPVVHYDFSPYNAFDNNPVYWADPSGADAYDTGMAMFNATPDGYSSTWYNQGDGGFFNNNGVLFDTNSFSFYGGFEISGNTNFSNGGSGATGAENLSNITIDAIRTPWGYSLAELGWRLKGHVYSQGEYYADYRSNRRWNAAHETLELFGLAPGIGEVFDAVNAGLYTYRGDYVNAGLSAGACVPFLGYAATGTKYVNKTTTLYRAVSKAELDDIAVNGFRNIGNYDTSKLFATSAQDAANFGRLNYGVDGLPFTIVKAQVPSSLMSGMYKGEMDMMQAVGVPTGVLNRLSSETLNHIPIPNHPWIK